MNMTTATKEKIIDLAERRKAHEGVVLNVGGGNRDIIDMPSRYDAWKRVYLDIDPGVKADICCDARNLATLQAGAYDAVYSSHNLEHFYAHEVPQVLDGVRHVLKPGGFFELWVPDVEGLIRHMGQNGSKLTDVIYTTVLGVQVTALDIIYGYQPKIKSSGVDFYAHKTGFSQEMLLNHLKRAGFRKFLFVNRAKNKFEIGIVAFRRYPTPKQEALLKFKASDFFKPDEKAQ